MKKDIITPLKFIVRGAIFVFIGMVISKLLTFIYMVFIARYFGAEDYGVFSLALAITGVFYIIPILGIPPMLTNIISENLERKNYRKIKNYSAFSVFISLILSMIISILVFLSSEHISAYLKNKSLITILYILSISIPFYSVCYIIYSIFIGFKKIEYKIISENIVLNFLKVVLTIAFGIAGFGLIGISAAYTIAWILVFIFSVILLFRKIVPLELGDFLFTDFKFIRLSLPILLTNFLGAIISYTDRIMIGYFKIVADVGIYNAALTLAQILLMPASFLSALFLPIISETYIKEGIKSVRSLYKTVVRWAFYLTFPAYVVFLIFSKQVLYIIFGEEYVSAYIALIVLSSGYLLSFLSVPAYNVILMFKKTKSIFYIGLSSTFINILMNFVLIPKFGINGAAFASFLSYFIIFAAYSYATEKKLKIIGIEKKYLVKSIISALLPAIFIYILKDFININIFTVLLMLSIYIILYISLLFVFRGFYKVDIEILLAIERKLGINLEFLKKILRKII